MASGLRPRRLLGTTKRANPDDSEHPGRASAALSGSFAKEKPRRSGAG
jgi:hypothetical protein